MKRSLGILAILVVLCTIVLGRYVLSYFYMVRALSAVEAEKYELALEHCTTAIRIDVNCDRCFANRSLIYVDLGRYESAFEDLKQAIRLNPTAKYYRARGSVYLALKQYEKALMDANQAVEREPNDKDNFRLRAEAYFRSEKYEEAIEDFSQVIELEPDSISAYANRGQSLALLRRFEEAIKDYTHVIDSVPDWHSISEIYTERGHAYGEVGKLKLSKQNLLRGIELGDRRSQSFFWLGVSHAELKETREAIKAYSQALELEPPDGELRRTLYDWRGALYKSLGEKDKAAADFRRRDQIQKSSPQKKEPGNLSADNRPNVAF